MKQATMRCLSTWMVSFAFLATINNVYAIDVANVNAATMITNFAASVPALMRLTTAIAYVLGIYLVMQSILGFKKFGDQRTQMSTESSLRGPIVMLFVGAALLYLPTSVQTGMATFWTNPSPYAYQTSESGPFQDFINACFMIVQLIGTIYFIKGLSMMTHLNSGGQQGGFSRALTHIIGGIFCINLYDFLNAIFVTLGLGQM
jgi:intracellular multiplication protein IcmC